MTILNAEHTSTDIGRTDNSRYNHFAKDMRTDYRVLRFKMCDMTQDNQIAKDTRDDKKLCHAAHATRGVLLACLRAPVSGMYAVGVPHTASVPCETTGDS
jgi:hypothetical protein